MVKPITLKQALQVGSEEELTCVICPRKHECYEQTKIRCQDVLMECMRLLAKKYRVTEKVNEELERQNEELNRQLYMVEEAIREEEKI